MWYSEIDHCCSPIDVVVCWVSHFFCMSLRICKLYCASFVGFQFLIALILSRDADFSELGVFRLNSFVFLADYTG